MRRNVWIITLMLISGIAMAQVWPTVGDVYNFEVGDTFQMRKEAFGQGWDFIPMIELSQYVIMEKTLSGATVSYKTQKNGVTYYPTAPWPYSVQPMVPSFVFLNYNNLWQDIQTYAHTTFSIDCDSIDECVHLDTMEEVLDGLTGFTHSYTSWSYVEKSAFIAGLGKVYEFSDYEDPLITTYSLSLIYYHKASGLIGGGYNAIPTGMENEISNCSVKAFTTENGDIVVNENECDPFEFTVHDVAGRLIASEMVSQPHKIISTELSPGIYYWIAENEGQKLTTGKLIFR